MMSIAPVDSAMVREAIEAPGGFVWWYLDAVDANGDGIVAIWSFGLPFLPGYLESCRQGAPPPAAERPSLNVAVYRGGKLDCYLLQEFEPEQVACSAEQGHWRFGRSEMATQERAGWRQLSVSLDCPVPGTDERLIGKVDLEGASPVVPSSGESPNRARTHRWHPRIICGEATIDLRVGTVDQYRSRGRAYHDLNCGTGRFDRLGIERWIWGRIPLEDREIVYFGLWPEEGAAQQVVLEFDEAGSWAVCEEVDVELEGARFNLGAMRWWKTIEVVGPAEADWSPMHIQVDDVVDSGPFYMRYLTDTTADGQRVKGVAELIRPSRIDLDRHRPFVRMRVHELGARNSPWLPLFTGPKRGRLRRLLSFNLGGK